MTALFLTGGIASVASWFALRYNFGLLGVGAAVAWIALFLTIKDNPPSGITEGSAQHVVMMLAAIVLAIAIPLVSLARQVTTQQDQTGAFSTTIKKLKWKKPAFMDSEEERGRKSRAEKMDRLYQHRMAMRSALRGRSNRKR